MSTAGGPRLSKNERRDAAREKAREQRLRQQRRERRNRIVLQVGIGVVVLAIVAIVAVVLVNSIRPPGPGPKNMADDGIVITKGADRRAHRRPRRRSEPTQRPPESGKVAIRTYEDFGCPVCGQFEKTNAAYIQTLLQQGNATLQIYPVAILDNNFAGSQYSTRAANAAAAVANYSPNQFYAFHTLLYANQPAEGTTGLTDDQLIGYAKQAKVTNLSAISDAIKNHQFFSWVDASTKRFVDADFAGDERAQRGGHPEAARTSPPRASARRWSSSTASTTPAASRTPTSSSRSC